jgi:hypothetical protein
MATFVECTSLSVNYDVTGIATVSYTVMSNSPGIIAWNTISVGNRVFTGYITSAANSVVPRTEYNDGGGPWYQTQVTLIAMAA